MLVPDRLCFALWRVLSGALSVVPRLWRLPRLPGQGPRPAGYSRRLGPSCLPARALAGENLRLAAAIIVEPLDPPLARRLAILENVGRFSAGLARLCHHVSGSEKSKSRLVGGPVARPQPGGRGI